MICNCETISFACESIFTLENRLLPIIMRTKCIRIGWRQWNDKQNQRKYVLGLFLFWIKSTVKGKSNATDSNARIAKWKYGIKNSKKEKQNQKSKTSNAIQLFVVYSFE